MRLEDALPVALQAVHGAVFVCRNHLWPTIAVHVGGAQVHAPVPHREGPQLVQVGVEGHHLHAGEGAHDLVDAVAVQVDAVTAIHPRGARRSPG